MTHGLVPVRFNREVALRSDFTANGRITFQVELGPGATWHTCTAMRPGGTR